MSRIPSHVAVAAAALVAGGLGATAFSSPDPVKPASAVSTRTLPPGPEQVRTVVVTKTIHRVRHVRVHPRHPAPAAAPPAAAPAVAPAPAPVAVLPQRVAVRAPAAPSHHVTTRTSGHGGGGGGGEDDGGEHEGGGDD